MEANNEETWDNNCLLAIRFNVPGWQQEAGSGQIYAASPISWPTNNRIRLRQVGFGASTTESGGSYWSLIVWAQYGKDHKKYWQKTYGTYQVPVKHAVGSSGESAGSGAAIGAYGTESYDFSSMDKTCADWGALVNSTLKVTPEPTTPKPQQQ